MIVTVLLQVFLNRKSTQFDALNVDVHPKMELDRYVAKLVTL